MRDVNSDISKGCSVTVKHGSHFKLLVTCWQ